MGPGIKACNRLRALPYENSYDVLKLTIRIIRRIIKRPSKLVMIFYKQ